MAAHNGAGRRLAAVLHPVSATRQRGVYLDVDDHKKRLRDARVGLQQAGAWRVLYDLLTDAGFDVDSQQWRFRLLDVFERHTEIPLLSGVVAEAYGVRLRFKPPHDKWGRGYSLRLAVEKEKGFSVDLVAKRLQNVLLARAGRLPAPPESAPDSATEPEPEVPEGVVEEVAEGEDPDRELEPADGDAEPEPEAAPELDPVDDWMAVLVAGGPAALAALSLAHEVVAEEADLLPELEAARVNLAALELRLADLAARKRAVREMCPPECLNAVASAVGAAFAE